MTTILLTGATGFVGSHVLPALLDAGHQVRALVRDGNGSQRVARRLTTDQRPRVTFAEGDVTRPASLAPALKDVDAVVHLVAIPRDRSGGREMARVNTQGTVDLLAAMRSAGVSRLVHLGALGVRDDPRLHYAGSKARAEAAVEASELRTTILKPSLMWGRRDGFFNIIAMLVRMSPGLVPIPARQHAKFQPLWVEDLARIVPMALEREELVGRQLELGGPEHWTYREMVQEAIRGMRKRRLIAPMPLPLIKLVAGGAETLHLPFPVASDQLRQLAYDNAASLDVVERQLGFKPRSMRGSLGYLRERRDDQ